MLAQDARRDWSNLRASGRTLFLTLAVSMLMGVAAWAFLTSLDLVSAVRDAHSWLFFLLPVVGVVTAWAYRTYGLRAGRGNNLVIDSSLTGTPIHARMAGLTFVCSVATHLVGGSAGREGTAVQIGGTIASNVAGVFKLTGRERQDLMLAGISAAFGSVFGTPLAGAFFGMEMCTIGKLNYGAALYCLAGSFVGDATARALGTVHAAYHIGTVPDFSASVLAVVFGAAVLFGLVARLFSFAIRAVKRFYGTRITHYLVAALAGSLVVLLAYLLLDAWHYAGLSTWMVEAGFEGAATPVDALKKLVMTALTLGAGFQGGEVTPLFGIGAALGGWIGAACEPLTHAGPELFAALGMCCVFGAALNVPITTIMLAIDLFGGTGTPYFVVAAFVSYLVAGHRGVYPSQRIVTPKRRSLSQDQGNTVEAVLEHKRAAQNREG